MKDDESKATLKLSDIAIGLFAMVIVLPMFAVPAQAVLEIIHWLQEASWVNYDWYMLTGYSVEQVDLGPELKGATTVLRWLMDTWISLPFSIVAGGIFLSIVD